MHRFVPFALILALAPVLPAAAEPPVAPVPRAATDPWFIDDEKYFDGFMEKLSELAENGKCLATDKLAERMKPERKARIAPAKPGSATLSPEEVYRRALPSVFVIGSVHMDEEATVDGLYATVGLGLRMHPRHQLARLRGLEKMRSLAR